MTNRCNECWVANQINYHAEQAEKNAAKRRKFARNIIDSLDSEVATDVSLILECGGVISDGGVSTLGQRYDDAPSFIQDVAAGEIVSREITTDGKRQAMAQTFVHDDLIRTAAQRLLEIPRNFNTCAGYCSALEDDTVRSANEIVEQRQIAMINAEQNNI
jgi:hypothetical protein